MHLPQLNISVVLTCFLLVYALVPSILTANVTPVDDICNFTYPLHCGQPFTDNDSHANETVHEVPLYIHTCSSYICFTHLFEFILVTRYYPFHHHTPPSCTSNQIQMEQTPLYTPLVGLVIHIYLLTMRWRFIWLTQVILLQRYQYMSTIVTVHKLQCLENYLSYFRLQLLHEPLIMCQQ
jgi:hypothetical protein